MTICGPHVHFSVAFFMPAVPVTLDGLPGTGLQGKVVGLHSVAAVCSHRQQQHCRSASPGSAQRHTPALGWSCAWRSRPQQPRPAVHSRGCHAACGSDCCSCRCSNSVAAEGVPPPTSSRLLLHVVASPMQAAADAASQLLPLPERHHACCTPS